MAKRTISFKFVPTAIKPLPPSSWQEELTYREYDLTGIFRVEPSGNEYPTQWRNIEELIHQATDSGFIVTYYHGPPREAAIKVQKKEIKCECGGKTANTTHSDWCDIYKQEHGLL